MTTPLEREKDRIRTVTGLLYQACKPIRLLRTLDWTPEVKASFLAGGGREPPQVAYPRFDPDPSIATVREALLPEVMMVMLALLNAWFLTMETWSATGPALSWQSGGAGSLLGLSLAGMTLYRKPSWSRDTAGWALWSGHLPHHALSSCPPLTQGSPADGG